MVVMDKEEYVSKAQDILQQPVYRSIPRDPTNKIKALLITKLRSIIRDNNLDDGMYKAMYPTGCVNHLRPLVSSRGSVTYGVATVLSKVLKPLVGKSPHHIQSTGNFVSKAKGITLQLGECLTSYNVTSLFTSVSNRSSPKYYEGSLGKG